MVPYAHMEYIDDIICELFHSSIQQYRDENFRHYMLALPLLGAYLRGLRLIDEGY